MVSIYAGTFVRRTLIALIVMISSANLACAASVPIPQEVASYIEDMKQSCKDAGGTPMAPEKTFLLSGHLKDAAHLDWAIDEGGFNCKGVWGFFSGAGGAQVEVFVGLPGNRARHASEHGANGMRLEHQIGHDTLWLHVGGPLCGQSGSPSYADSVQCERPLAWNNATGEFDFAPLSTIKILSRPKP